jgi:SAM-dependent methyltransferase
VEWFENEEYWSAFDGLMFSAERIANGSREVDAVLALVEIRAESAVLDLCCGPGRHAVWFAVRGHRVTGVDRSPGLLTRARVRAAEVGVSATFVQQDAREFLRPGEFDLAVNLFTSFGYFDSEADQRRLLRNVHASLKTGGTFVVEMMGKEVLARIFQECVSTPGPDDTLFVCRHTVVRDWTRVRNDWSVLSGGSVRHFQFEHWIYSGRELRDLLVEAGFADVRLFGGLDGQEYGSKAMRLVAVARKRED